MTTLTDDADWSGILMVSVGVVGKSSGIKYGKYRYVTPGEVAVARLLDSMGVPFTPDVSIKVFHPDWSDTMPMVYVPDFIFDKRACIWTDRDGGREIVHGIEVKHRTRKSGMFPAKGLKKIAVLRKAKGINIKIVDELTVQKLTGLPITKFDI
ncbi:MAG: hypothetical protein U9Q03_03810 [Patescibacteria group bacterium]|nr:hypothetical protein [Patescibacteria group bacterium]